MIEQHITKLIKELDLPPLEPQDSEQFLLPISDDLTVSLKDLSPGVLFGASLGSIATQNREDLLTYFMKANFLGQGTGEQTLGINPDDNCLTLSRSITYELDYSQFKEVLEDFINYLTYWKGELKRMQTVQSIL